MSNREKNEGSDDTELKRSLGARSERVAELTQELSVLCREIEETSHAVLSSVDAQFEAARAAAEQKQPQESVSASSPSSPSKGESAPAAAAAAAAEDTTTTTTTEADEE